jgi:hypothetical protein
MMVNIFICYDEKHRGSLRCAGEAKLKTFRQQFFCPPRLPVNAVFL